MSPTVVGSTPEERMTQGRELYRRLILPTVEEANLDRFVAFDLLSEDYELDEDLLEMCRRLRARHPDARIVGFRVGNGGGAVDSFSHFRREAAQ